MQITIKKNIPDFFIVGAAKSGTTSLWYYLGQHPDIFMTRDVNHKELGYFCHHYGVSSFDTYTDFFREAKENQLIGEACHSYLSSPESAEWIHQYNPNAKIILILRNPVDRAYSLYNWMVAHGYEYASSFEKALSLEECRLSSMRFRDSPIFPAYFRNYAYYSSGLYSQQIKRYLEVFGREKCLVLLFEEFKRNIDLYVNNLLSFLNISLDVEFNSEVQNQSFSVRYPFIAYHLKHNYNRICRKLALPKLIYNPIGTYLDKWNTLDTKPDKLKVLTAKMLQDKYYDDIIQVGELIKKDTSLWLKY